MYVINLLRVCGCIKTCTVQHVSEGVKLKMSMLSCEIPLPCGAYRP